MNKLYLSVILTVGLAACGNPDTKKSSDTPVAPNSEVSKPVDVKETAEKKPEPAPVITPLERGRKLYARCKTCHTLEEGGKHRVGPNLWDVYGKKAGSRPDFAYSKVMKASDVIWTDETIDAYIAKPATFMKGNRMSFVGIKKAEDRAALLEYLRENTQPATPE